MDEVKDSFWDYSSLLMFNALAMLVGFGNMFLMTRWLGAAGFGAFNLLLLVVNLTYIFSVNWTNAAMLRFGKEDHLRTGRLNEVFWSRMTVLALPLLLAFAVLALFRGPLAQYAGVSRSVYMLAPLLVLALMFSDIVKFLFQAVGGVRWYALVIFLEKLFVMVLLLGLERVVHGTALWGVVAAYGAGFLLAPLAAGVKFPVRALFPPHVSREKVRRILMFSWPILFGSLGVYITNWVDLAVIKAYQDNAAVGIYSLSYRLMTAAQQFSMLVIPLTLPMIIAFKTQGNIDAIKRYLGRFVPQGVFFWSLILCAGMMLCRALVPRVFGAQFAGAIVPLNVLFLALGMNLLACFHSAVVTTYEIILPKQILEVAAGVVNLVVDLILVPRIGIIGAAVGTLCAFTLNGVGAQVLANRVHGTLSVRQFAPVIFVAVVFCLSTWIRTPVFYLFSLAALGFCIILTLKVFRLFRPGDEEFLERVAMPASARRAGVRIFKMLARIS